MKAPNTDQEALVSHAALTPKARLGLARVVVDDGWPIARAAERFQLSWPTAKRWVERYLTATRPQDRALAVEATARPVATADRVGPAASTVHAVLVRCRLDDRASHPAADSSMSTPPQRVRNDEAAPTRAVR